MIFHSDINKDHKLYPAFEILVSKVSTFCRKVCDDGEEIPLVSSYHPEGYRDNLVSVGTKNLNTGKEYKYFSAWIDEKDNNIGLNASDGMLWDYIDDSYQTPLIKGWDNLLDNFEYDVEYGGQYTIYSLAEEG